MICLARWKRDVILGVCFEAFFVVAFVFAFKIPVGTMGDMVLAQPGVYLRMWLVVFALLSLTMIINAIRKKDTTVVKPMLHPQVVFTLVLVGLYIFLMDIIGFTVSTLVFMTGLILDYSWAAGKFLNPDGSRKKGIALVKSVLFYVILSIIIVAITQYVFESLLMVKLP